MKVKFGVEALGETRTAVVDIAELGLTDSQWLEMTEEQRNEYVKEWAYNEAQMGYWYEEAE